MKRRLAVTELAVVALLVPICTCLAGAGTAEDKAGGQGPAGTKAPKMPPEPIIYNAGAEKSVFYRILWQGKIIRERETVIVKGTDGVWRIKETSMEVYYGAGPYENLKVHQPWGDYGPRHFSVSPYGMRQFQKDTGGQFDPDPKDPGAACPLDDPAVVPDEDLEKYAYSVVLTYDEKCRSTFFLFGPEDKFPPTSGHKSAFLLNPDYSKKAPPVEKANTWHEGFRIQSVDAKGNPLAGVPRRTNLMSGGAYVFRLEMDMDYSASPRPVIKQYRIDHFYTLIDNAIHDVHFLRNPLSQDQYKVEIEDVADGDPAMQGQWIKNIRFDAQAIEASPQGRQAADAAIEQRAMLLLAEARLLEEQGLTDAAKREYERILQNFPGTAAGKVAANRLEVLNGPPKTPAGPVPNPPKDAGAGQP
jgi:hypothetical protein